MSLPRFAALSCLLFGSAVSKPAPRPVAQASATVSSSLAIPTVCGDIIQDADFNGVYVFSASQAYQCLASVPFNDAVALRFIEYYNTTMQFQSTLAYLKNPPEGYQQPAVDLIDQLAVIKQNISAGYYKNQYAFEAEVQKLVYSVHDMHVDLWSGILSAFAFGSSYEIVSVSKDGKEAPQIYITGDILYTNDPQPITAINGEDPVEFLSKFAALNSPGTLEPHADWNQLMSSPAIDIQGLYNVFSGGATFYPGDKLTFTWADDSYLDDEWIAIYTNPAHTGPLTTGGDFYNYFVLGLIPASYNESVYPIFDDGSGDDDTSSDNVTNWNDASYGAYPTNPVIVQEGLSSGGGGIVTGYFLNGTSTGVLSIPSFDMYGDYIGSFAQAVINFITQAQEANITNVVIDLQQNLGGQSLLAYDTYKRFFPDGDAYRGSRRRSHAMADALGRATTGYWDSLQPGTDDYDNFYELLAADEWVVTDRLNADTGANFTSWAEYYGPRTYNGDTFSLTERYNLTSDVFSESAFDGWSLPDEYPAQPWPADKIVLLTDGLCSSTCAEFLEMMTQRGARTVVAGGRPTPGPMQAASGTRGARLYSADLLDTDIEWVRDLDNSTHDDLPEVRDPGIQTVSFAGVNLRDQVREGDGTPLQFKYLAAHCRIYFTLANVYNMTRLWLDAATATWEDEGLCVEGSTGYAASGNETAAKAPPPRTAEPVEVNALVADLDVNTEADTPLLGLEAGIGTETSGIQLCPKSGGCGPKYKAVQNVPINCGKTVTACVCLPLCSGSVAGSCPGGLSCKDKSSVQSKQVTSTTTSRSPKHVIGSKGGSAGTCRESGQRLAGSRALCGAQWKS